MTLKPRAHSRRSAVREAARGCDGARNHGNVQGRADVGRNDDVRGYKIMVVFGLALAGLLTLSLAVSLSTGSLTRVVINAGLLWVTVDAIQRNFDNLTRLRGGRSRRANPNRPGGRSSI